MNNKQCFELSQKLKEIDVNFFWEDVNEKNDCEYAIAFICDAGCYSINLGYGNIISTLKRHCSEFDVYEHFAKMREYRPNYKIEDSQKIKDKLFKIIEILDNKI